jgi:DNA-binding CsgD family transcriptional regulator
MLPRVQVGALDRHRHSRFARALSKARDFDLTRPVESLHGCMRTMDTGFVLELGGENPLGWSYDAQAGVERMNGAARVVSRLGELPDQDFTARVLVPSYLDVIEAGGPLVHEVAAVANRTFVSYRRLTIPVGGHARSGRQSRILALTEVGFAIPLAGPTEDIALTCRERECLSLAASGLPAKQIAAEIGTSEKTVELHLSQARRKLGARSTAHAVAMSMALAMIN